MLLRHTLLYLPAQLLAPAAQFAAAVLWTHWLSPEDYGVLTFIMAAQELVFVLSLFWWSSFCLRYFAGFDAAEKAGYRRSEAAILGFASLGGFLAAVPLLGYLHVLTPSLLFVSGLFLLSRCLNTYLAEQARAQERILDYTFAQTAGPVLGFALSLLVMRIFWATPTGALAGFAMAQVAAVLWVGRRLGLDFSLRRPDPLTIQRALAYGAPLVLAGMFAWISFNGIRFVVQEMGGEAAMGLLAVGWNLGLRLAAVTAMLVTAAAYPLAVRRLASHTPEEALRQLAAGGTLLVALVLPATVGLAQIGEPLVRLLIAPPFQAATLAILPATVALGAVRNIRGHYAEQSFLLFERTRATIWIYALEAVLAVLLSAAGYRWAGLQGAAFGALASTMFVTIAVFAVARRAFGLPLPLADWGRIGLAAILMLGVLRGLERTIHGVSDATLIGVEVPLGAMVYAAALAALFPRRVWGLVRRVKSPRPPREAGVSASAP